MKIETKFDIGDTAYMLENNKVRTDEVRGITIVVDTAAHYMSRVTTVYTLGLDGRRFDDNKLFKTKQELLDSL